MPVLVSQQDVSILFANDLYLACDYAYQPLKASLNLCSVRVPNLQDLYGLGYNVALITSREESIREGTEANLLA